MLKMRFSAIKNTIYVSANNKKLNQIRWSSSVVTPEAAAEGMVKWKQYSAVGAVIVGISSVYNYFAHHGHDHEHGEEEPHPTYTHLQIKAKPFPWKYSECNLLDFECKRKAQEAEQALNN